MMDILCEGNNWIQGSMCVQRVCCLFFLFEIAESKCESEVAAIPFASPKQKILEVCSMNWFPYIACSLVDWRDSLFWCVQEELLKSNEQKQRNPQCLIFLPQDLCKEEPSLLHWDFEMRVLFTLAQCLQVPPLLIHAVTQRKLETNKPEFLHSKGSLHSVIKLISFGFRNRLFI